MWRMRIKQQWKNRFGTVQHVKINILGVDEEFVITTY